MKSRRSAWLGAVALALVLVVAVVWWRGRPGPPAADSPPPAVSAQVQVVSVLARTLPETLTAFGEVTTGKVTALSFPRAGQLSRLNVIPGQRVRRGDLLATLASDPNTQLAYTQATTAVSLAQREWQRLQELLTLRLATQSQVDTAHKTYLDAQALLVAQRQLGGAEGEARLLAPFEAVVTGVPVAQGDRIQAGAAVLQLGTTQQLRVRMGIEPADSRRVAIGTPVTLAPLNRATTPIPATIAEIQDVVDPKTQLVDAIAVLPDAASLRLVPGMRVLATLTLGQRTVTAVPRDAVLSDEQGTYVFQVISKTAHRVAVVRGLESGGLVEIMGADPKLPVVTLGNYELEEGMQVRVAGS